MDRLPQLRAAAGLEPSPAPATISLSPCSSPQNYSPKEGGAPVQVAFTIPPSEIDQDTIDTLDAFYGDVAAVLGSVKTIRAAMHELQQKHTENMQTVDEARSKALRSEIDELSRETGNAAKAAKEKLDAMSTSTAKLKSVPDSVQANSAIIRIEENQYMHLVLKLTMAMAEYQRQQSSNEAYYKAQTQRQIKIKYTNPDGSAIDDSTAAQLAEQVMENDTSSSIFQQSKEVLASIIETRNDIYRIEQSMRDLNQLFNDLAFLVKEQGELMDVILANVQQSTRYVEKGREALKKARRYQKKSRKKLRCRVVRNPYVEKTVEDYCPWKEAAVWVLRPCCLEDEKWAA
ncbi:Qa-SNARE protein [Leishmania mexicana MHOM/GT/2001/U1103]|uniref:Qa-SNARE protein n=1 Tax=Leishmania mexicana (strain MHOM/GT/2001/U1103) TaxID=929439 RepID=E9AZW7_LEIMU|nr:Qa-SNARE protein [Leishmania mexicana MHOM/GT/2001/U1103]CBZ28518.1 Qa-SNARE protein [Leishmania mexicana MHOM/GT/2001/U1103]